MSLFHLAEEEKGTVQTRRHSRAEREEDDRLPPTCRALSRRLGMSGGYESVPDHRLGGCAAREDISTGTIGRAPETRARREGPSPAADLDVLLDASGEGSNAEH